ncbi:MAG: DegT/DnrJ/EryC1/StrS family aminotransferase [Thermomicrobiales bacterium]
MAQRLAIDGGTPARSEPFPAWPIFDEREERQLLDVLHSGRWGTISGDKVATFARRFAEFQDARFGVCVPNGTLALEMSLQALDVGPGDEVITTPYTFIATATAILIRGAKPVFVDINPATYNIDAAQIEPAITERTKAIVPVHVGGQPAAMDAILAVARHHNLRVLEDACQAWGAQWNGHGVGALGDLGCFSFQASKNITAGEGGIVLTNDDDLYARCWSLHNVGRVPEGAWYQHEILGRNLRLAEWEGAILLAQLERLPEHASIREANAATLDQALRTRTPGITPATVDRQVTRHAHHLFLMRYDKTAFGEHTRDEFLTALHAEGITPASAGYVPLTHSPAIRRTFAELFGPPSVAELQGCPEAVRAASDTIWLNQTALLGTPADVESIVAAIEKIQRAWS